MSALLRLGGMGLSLPGGERRRRWSVIGDDLRLTDLWSDFVRQHLSRDAIFGDIIPSFGWGGCGQEAVAEVSIECAQQRPVGLGGAKADC
jgi:hypothetical protein